VKKISSSLIVIFGSVVFLGVLFIAVASSYFHRRNVVANSEYRYTVVTLADYYSKGKVSGKVITY
jgi:ABC-type transporter Mla subunit MlaD